MSGKKNTNIIIGSILLVSMAITLFYYPSVPDIIPTHWGINGQVDGTGPKWMLFVFLGIAAFVNILMLFAEKIEPKKGSYAKFPKVFNILRIFITALLCGLELLSIAFAFDPDFADMNTIMYISMGFMFVLLGNYMPKVKHNYTFGIKTPWTFASENVWNKTHRMAGPLWVAGGIFIAGGAFLPDMAGFLIMFSIILLLVIIPMVYSYNEFKKEDTNEKDN
ncbi:MAG: SdpI family protein [Oscillospiraceae bacterium]|nr:SdpI family protein [Oscillospiraceae bacterium]